MNEFVTDNLTVGQLTSSSFPYSGYTQQYFPPTIVEREPFSFEFKIQKNGNQIRMDYGAELRLLMADPVKGIDLREAIAKLKEALERI